MTFTSSPVLKFYTELTSRGGTLLSLPATSILCLEAPAMDAKKTMESNLELSPSRM